MPRAWFMTDDRLSAAETLSIINTLGPSVGVIFRHYKHLTRNTLALCIATACKRRRLTLLVAGDEKLAQRVGAHGVHWPAALTRPRRKPSRKMIITSAAHNRADLVRATRMSANAAFLSPVFPTRSHSDAATLGIVCFGLMQRTVSVNVMALGGVNRETLKRLKPLKLAGYAAIDGFMEHSHRRPDVPCEPV